MATTATTTATALPRLCSESSPILQGLTISNTASLSLSNGIHVVIEAGFGMPANRPTYAVLSAMSPDGSRVLLPNMISSHTIDVASLPRWRWHVVLPRRLDDLVELHHPHHKMPSTSSSHPSSQQQPPRSPRNSTPPATPPAQVPSSDASSSLEPSTSSLTSTASSSSSSASSASSSPIEYSIRVAFWEKHRVRSDCCIGSVLLTPLDLGEGPAELTQSQQLLQAESTTLSSSSSAYPSPFIQLATPPPVFSVAHPLPLPCESPLYDEAPPLENWLRLVPNSSFSGATTATTAAASSATATSRTFTSSPLSLAIDGVTQAPSNTDTATSPRGRSATPISPRKFVSGLISRVSDSISSSDSNQATAPAPESSTLPTAPEHLRTPWILASAFTTMLPPRAPFTHARSAARPGAAVRIGILDVEVICHAIHAGEPDATAPLRSQTPPPTTTVTTASGTCTPPSESESRFSGISLAKATASVRMADQFLISPLVCTKHEPCHTLFSLALHDGAIPDTLLLKLKFEADGLLQKTYRLKHTLDLPDGRGDGIQRRLRQLLEQQLSGEYNPDEHSVTSEPVIAWERRYKNLHIRVALQYRLDPRFCQLDSSKLLVSEASTNSIHLDLGTIPPPPLSHIVTDKFKERFDALAEDFRLNRKKSANHARERFDSLYPEAKRLHCFFVGGLFSSQYPGYYSANMKRLRKIGIGNVTNLPTNGVFGSAKNASTIASHIEALAASTPELGRDIVLIGHSKGVADIHVTLAMYPHLRRYIFGVIAIQGAFGGTILLELLKIADVAATIGSVVSTLLSDFEWSSVEDCAYDTRSLCIKQYPYPDKEIPTVCLASYKDFKDSHTLNVLEQSMAYIGSSIVRSSGYECDGILLQCDERIPGSMVDTVLIDCMHHGNGCFSLPNLPYRPGPMTQVLLEMLLDQVRSRSAASSAESVATAAVSHSDSTLASPPSPANE